MKKKPIYLYILLGLSTLVTLLGIWGRFFNQYTVIDYTQAGYSAALSDQLNEYSKKSYELSHNGISILLFFLSAAVLIAAIVVLLRKNVQLANIIYIFYVLLAIIGLVYNYVSASPLFNLFTDEATRKGMRSSSLLGVAVFVGLNLVFLGLTVFKLLKLQKELEKEEIQAVQ
ncbi:hypothetical protein STRDD11_00555 [Streptococcus sp. DD11]|uniref:ABC transporter permease n=1 Tax=Streptococcus sp. DD11 TaxID=1777879 RepID=UPI00079B0C58|nr:hypothetical protein [Streptococcus sp. DD11]KXT85089.1 hypothetical protein STRDD11_00555 [Streptococcus sp. DD11]